MYIFETTLKITQLKIIKMKKLSVLFASFLAIVVLVSSCSKEESEGKNDLGKATISGKVWMDYEDQSANPTPALVNNDNEFAPEGIQLIATINADDLMQDGNGANIQKKTYYTTVDANGNYSFTIDCGAKTVNVKIEGEDKMYNYNRWKWDPVIGAFTYQTSERAVWKFAPINVAVVNKQDKILDITYLLDSVLED